MSNRAGSDRQAADPLIWILRSTGLGADRQLANLAGALSARTRWIDTLDPTPRALFERLTAAERRPIPAAKRGLLQPPWPDLVLFSGGRSLVDALRIRRASGGRSKIVCIGRTGGALDRVDLVLTTPQYCLPEHPNVVHLDLPLNFVDEAALVLGRRKWQATFKAWPRPWHGVLLGGSSGSYRFDAPAGRRLGDALQALVGRCGGSLLITTSPRSGAAMVEAMLAGLEGEHYVYRWSPEADENPLAGIFALADDFVVTADSASMLAEACLLGRPVAVFEPPLDWRARWLDRRRLQPARDSSGHLPRPSRRDRWTARGRWIPARRMQRIHRQLESQGLITPIDQLGPDAPPALSGAGRSDLQRAVEAVRRLLEPA
ncbi:MAG: ELM1/GtrOC1 family putative glycosyltransferase [Wenzhouxiangellaceae bacterium]|nr:ELM1/GtrOC1 family putative glycosyltransferase [Wenzhouxiangellaceae bacterium]